MRNLLPAREFTRLLLSIAPYDFDLSFNGTVLESCIGLSDTLGASYQTTISNSHCSRVRHTTHSYLDTLVGLDRMVQDWNILPFLVSGFWKVGSGAVEPITIKLSYFILFFIYLHIFVFFFILNDEYMGILKQYSVRCRILLELGTTTNNEWDYVTLLNFGSLSYIYIYISI